MDTTERGIALVAHDNKKPDLVEWCVWNRVLLARHDLVATGTTGTLLEEELTRRYPGVRFVRYDTFGSTHGRDEGRVLAELPAKLEALEVDAVISGMAC